MENVELLIQQLIAQEHETEWLEFKVENCTPDMIGEDISALANGASYCERPCAYMIWGVDDTTHDIVGTSFDYERTRIGGQELQGWLRRMLSPNASFTFQKVMIAEKALVLLVIYKAISHPVSFKKVEHIRVGSYTKKLNEFPAMASKLWANIHEIKFETLIAKSDLSAEEALRMLNYTAYFDLTEQPQPTTQEGLLECMMREDIIHKLDNNLYAISNMGALLFAKQLSDFPRIARKAIRVVQYKGNNKIEMLKEYSGTKGYAVGFEGLISFIEAILPSQEIIDGALRRTIASYPTLAIREVVANALIHQDFSISGAGPVVEIFEKRIEITNPGVPLVDVQRIVDTPPKSRNESIASFMRRLHICEELGTGWDKIVSTCEAQLLPAPKINLYGESTQVTLFAEIPFNNIVQEDKLWACYLHACIHYISGGESITNASVRARFGLADSASASVSRLIRDAVREKLIKPLDPHTAPRYMRYVPYWA